MDVQPKLVKLTVVSKDDNVKPLQDFLQAAGANVLSVSGTSLNLEVNERLVSHLKSNNLIASVSVPDSSQPVPVQTKVASAPTQTTPVVNPPV